MKNGTIDRVKVQEAYQTLADKFGDDMPMYVIGMLSQLHAYKTVMQEVEKTAFFQHGSKLTPYKALLHIQHILKRLQTIPRVDIENRTPQAEAEVENQNESSGDQ